MLLGRMGIAKPSTDIASANSIRRKPESIHYLRAAADQPSGGFSRSLAR
jgi:hypothetical protein